MRLGAFLCLATTAACGGAFTTPGNDGGPGGVAGKGGDAGGIAGGAGSLGGHPGTGGLGGAAGDLGGSPVTGGAAGMAGRPGTGGSAGSAVSDSGFDFGTCDQPGQCILMPVSCCGVCGQPTASDFVAINSSYANAYQMQRCPIALPCPACATAPNPDIGARCVQGRCQVFVVQQVPEYSACQAPSDCVLRNGLGCCECTGNGWVSVSRSGDLALAKDECAPNTACPACAPAPPPYLVTTCTSENVCSRTELIP